MTALGRILVITSCTSMKADSTSSSPRSAEDLYLGQQHVRLMRGVQAYRRAGEPNGCLSLHVLSAEHGLVNSSAQLASYDTTFSGMPRAEVRTRGARLGIPADMANLLAQDWELVILLLGDLYLHASNITDECDIASRVLALTSPKAGRRLPKLAHLTVLPLQNRDAQRFSCGLTSLKGELVGRLLEALVHTSIDAIPKETESLLDWFAELPRPVPDRAQLQIAA